MTLFMENFHFLRPLWLAAFIPAGVILFLMHRKRDRINTYKQIIAPHLLKHLIVGENKKARLVPIYLLMVFWILTILALAGPAFQQEPSPFSEDTASVMIALKVTDSMQASDIQPTRQIRAVQKIKDFLATRPGAKTGLIGYSGTAHLAMPLTTDAKIIETFAQELSSEIMPEKGDDVSKALELSDYWLEKSNTPGSILLIVDDIDPGKADLLKEFRNKSNTLVHIFAIAAKDSTADTIPLNSANLKNAASALNATLTLVTADDSDIKRLSSNIKQRFSQVQNTNEGSRWKDAGYYFVPLIVILGLLWFRQGWIVKWE